MPIRLNEFSPVADIDGTISSAEKVRLATIGFDLPTGAPVTSTPYALSEVSNLQSIRVNGRDFREFGFLLQEYPNILFPSISHRFQQILFHSGSRSHGARYEHIEFSVKGIIHGLTHADFISKLDALRQWLDVEQSIQYEYLLGTRQSAGALLFEIAGHRYWYTEGTITGNVGSRTLIGSGTRWKSFLHPGSLVEINGHSSRYTIQYVISNTEIALAMDLKANASGTYRAERKRFLVADINDRGTLSPFSDKGFLSQSRIGDTAQKASGIYHIEIPMVSTYPYWFSEPINQQWLDISSGTFIELDGIGNAPTHPIITFTGSVGNPSITATEVSFISPFHFNTRAITLYNESEVTAVTSADIRFTQEHGVIGVDIDELDQIYYNAVPVNPNHFGFISRLFFRFDSDTPDLKPKYIFDSFDSDKSDGFNLYFDPIDDSIVFVIRSGNANTEIRTDSPVRFLNGSYLEISGWFNKDTSTGELVINGATVATATGIVAPLTTMSKLVVGAEVIDPAIPTHRNYMMGVIAELALFCYTPSTQELKRYYTLGNPILNRNATIRYSGTIPDYQQLSIDTGSQQRNHSQLIAKLNGSNVSVETNISGISPDIWDRNGTEKQIFYVSADGNIPILDIHCTPHWR